MAVICLFSQDQDRRTPLHAAACLGDVHIMDLLINSGNFLLDWVIISGWLQSHATFFCWVKRRFVSFLFLHYI